MHPTFFLTDPTAGAADSEAEGEGNASAQRILKLLLHSNHFLTPSVICFFYRYQERTLLKDNKELREKVNAIKPLVGISKPFAKCVISNILCVMCKQSCT